MLIHQQLDGEGAHYVRNAARVREALEASGSVLAVLQGHRHEAASRVVNGIPYFTFKGLIEGAGPDHNAYSIVEVMPDHTLRIRGSGRPSQRRCDARRR